jgi:hypothetical protein
MKRFLEYEEDDLARLIQADLLRQGYAVSREDLGFSDRVTVSITVTDEMVQAPVVSAPLAAVAAAPSATTPAAPSVPATPPGPRPPTRAKWSSMPKGGGDPRYTTIEEPTLAPRKVAVRELGNQTGLLARLGIDETQQEPTPEEEDFLARYMRPEDG